MTGAAEAEDTGRQRHFLSLRDVDDDVLRHLVDQSCRYAAAPGPVPGQPLAGRIVATYFRKTSTRTRAAFSVAAVHLGAAVLPLGPDDLQENTGESRADTGRVLGAMVDALVIRTAGPDAELRDYAAQGRIPVINAMSAEEHPTQAVADLATMRHHLGTLDGVRVLYLGEGNNTAAALALALSRYKRTELHLRTPPGYGLAPDVLATAVDAARNTGSVVEEQHDMNGLPAGVDVVYTTRWQTTGTTKPTADWRTVFAPFSVTSELMDEHPGACFLHDLPAHRGEEVAAEVLDGARSLAFVQAGFKLHSAKAVLEWCVADRP
jgi:ornithine carbamoyltransferase